jgi:hypothetical protein
MVCVWLAAPIEFRLRVTDEIGRPIEAVRVRWVSAADARDFDEKYTDPTGRVVFHVDGVRKLGHLMVNPAPREFHPGAFHCDASSRVAGPTYEGRRLCSVRPHGHGDAPLEVALGNRLPTRQVCRLSGRAGSNGPYQYAGQDSAITVPWLRIEGGAAKQDVLWWFGDTTDIPGGEIYVPNKMARTDGASDASRCLALEYLGPRDHAPLPVDPGVATEATVWLDLPLVSSTVPERRADGAYAFRPTKGDRLHVGYLSVQATQPFFKVTHLGLATLPECDGDCMEAFRRDGPRMLRESDAVWHAPVEYARAPEQSVLAFGDTYTILKVVERRTFCADPPHDVDCSQTRPCPRGGRCIEPGKFCAEPPHVSCLDDDGCAGGACVRGGVTAIRVSRDRVTSKAAYRYWNAATRSFEPFVSREPDAILVDASLGNSVSVMWSEFLSRWIMISNVEAPHYTGQRQVVLRIAEQPLGPWSAPVLIMENLGGQRSYNPRFVPHYTRPTAPNLVYWTATYDAYDESWPMHGMDFDYNVFLYETDLARVARPPPRIETASAGSE